MPIKFLVLGGGGILGFFGGGGKCRSYFYGIEDFSDSVSTPVKKNTKQGDARGTSEVRLGTSSIHLHCPVLRSSSHIGYGMVGLCSDSKRGMASALLSISWQYDSGGSARPRAHVS